MIEDLKPYPAHKDSGVPWLGEVPATWDLRRMKTLLRERVAKGFPDEPMLAATQTKGVVRKEEYENRTVLAMKDLHLLKLVKQGDFVISLRSFQGGIEYAREQGIISPAYTILFPTDAANHGYLAWLFKSSPYIGNLKLFVTGIRQGQNVDYERLGRSQLPLPCRNEQVAIIRFLDHMDHRIRRCIAAKKKLISLLNEQKQAIINRAVTRGLDPNVPLKPSGVEWLGEVPEHWRIMRLKTLVLEAVAGPYGSSLTKAMYTTQGYRVYGQQQVIPDDFSLGNYYISAEQFMQMQKYRVFPGDLLVSVMGTVGRAAIVPEDLEAGIINPRLVRYRPDLTKVRARFLQLAIQSSAGRTQLVEASKGTTMEGLNMQILGRLVFAVPSMKEQDDIVEYCHSKISALSSATERLQREIDLIREYRTRLTADVVTGKLDVREAAASMSDAIEPSETLDDADETENDQGLAGVVQNKEGGSEDEF